MHGRMQGRGALVLLLRGLRQVFAFDDVFPIFRELDVLL